MTPTCCAARRTSAAHPMTRRYRQLGDIAEFVRPGVLMGSTDQMVHMIGNYVDASAAQINLALRAPFEIAALEAVADAIAHFPAT